MNAGKAANDTSSSVSDVELGISSESDISLQGASALGKPLSHEAPPTSISPHVPEKWLENDESEDVDYDGQMAQMSAEMETLDREAQRLEKRQKYEAMRKELDSKRQKVSDLKDTLMGPAHSAEVDKRSNNKFMSSQKTPAEISQEKPTGTSGYLPLTDLPDDILGEVLLRLPATDLVRSCVYVSRRWRDILGSQTLWKEKCKRDHYYTDEMLLCVEDFKRHYFKNPYNSNLIKNPIAKEGLSHWKIRKNGGDGFRHEPQPWGAHPVKNFAHCDIDGPIGCWATSFSEGKKEQEVDLVGSGCSQKVLDDVRPDICISEWYAARSDSGCRYKIKIKLLDVNRQVLDCFKFEDEKKAGRDWYQFSHVFTSYPPGCRYIKYIHGGTDQYWWAGHYGVKMTLSSVKFDFSHTAGPYKGEFVTTAAGTVVASGIYYNIMLFSNLIQVMTFLMCQRFILMMIMMMMWNTVRVMVRKNMTNRKSKL